MSLRVGDTVKKYGFFTKAIFLRGVNSAEVERRVGYRAGRLAKGWYLLFMTGLPGPADFEVRGYSQMSGGVAQGHLPQPPDPRNSEQVLRDGSYDLQHIKQKLIAEVFTINGPQRLAKVIPVQGEFGSEDYPPGSGIPQWTLVKEKEFKVAAFIAPGQMYSGNYL